MDEPELSDAEIDTLHSEVLKKIQVGQPVASERLLRVNVELLFKSKVIAIVSDVSDKIGSVLNLPCEINGHPTMIFEIAHFIGQAPSINGYTRGYRSRKFFPKIFAEDARLRKAIKELRAAPEAQEALVKAKKARILEDFIVVWKSAMKFDLPREDTIDLVRQASSLAIIEEVLKT